MHGFPIEACGDPKCNSKLALGYLILEPLIHSFKTRNGRDISKIQQKLFVVRFSMVRFLERIGSIFQHIRRWSAFVPLSLFVAVVVLESGCNDPLPTYVQPKVTIATIIPPGALDTVLYAESGDTVPPSGVVELRAPQPILFNFTEVNQYQETLYGTAAVSGKLELWAVDRPGVGITLPITEDNIVPNTAYNSKTGILTMDPNFQVPFRVSWDLKDSKGNRFYDDIDEYRIEPYTGNFGYTFLKVFSIKIHVRISIQLYAQSSTFSGEQDFILNALGGIVYFK